jgi:DNA-directed RNA polymerase specialized sigma24 family protein
MEPADELRASIDVGNPDWASVYRTYSGIMRAAARSVLDTDQREKLGVSVDDVVHAVMVKLMAKSPGQAIPPDTNNVAAFLHVATRRDALNALDKARRAGQHPYTGAGEPGEPLTREDFEEGVEDAIICAQLDAHTHLLTKDERYAYEQRIKCGRPLTEVGAGMGGKSDSYAARMAGRAIRKLTAVAGIEAVPSPRPRTTSKRNQGDDEQPH